jgi:hypothetical protein
MTDRDEIRTQNIWKTFGNTKSSKKFILICSWINEVQVRPTLGQTQEWGLKKTSLRDLFTRVETFTGRRRHLIILHTMETTLVSRKGEYWSLNRKITSLPWLDGWWILQQWVEDNMPLLEAGIVTITKTFPRPYHSVFSSLSDARFYGASKILMTGLNWRKYLLMKLALRGT